ncbi:MAG: type II toxin-antitoxin system RelE/ParE family toxin [Pseudomonadota bacterium]
MRVLIYLDAATDDLVEILRYITLESRHLPTGLRFVEKLRARCSHLASLPGTLGSDRSDLAPGLRSVAAHGYIIFFRYGDESVEIANILHASRDVVSHFDED